MLPNSLKSALVPFCENPVRTGWLGEMRYGLLNDHRKLDKAAFPLMVQRYVALAYDKADVPAAAALPQPLLWPKLVVRDEDIAESMAAFNISDHRPVVGFVRGRIWPAKRWPHYHYGELAKKLIDERDFQIVLFGSEKITLPVRKSSPCSVMSNAKTV